MKKFLFILTELEALRIINALSEADEKLKGLDELIHENWRIREKLQRQMNEEQPF